MFKKIGVAIAFSPRCEAILTEAKRLKELFNAELLLIHIGERNQSLEEFLENAMQAVGLERSDAKIVWEQGNPARKILSISKKEKIDLLVAGALRKENFIKFYIGSIARRILRRADCSVLMLTTPHDEVHPFDKIVVQAGGATNSKLALWAGAEMSRLENASIVHIIKEIQLYGLSMAIASEESEDEYSEMRKNLVNDELKDVQQKLEDINTEGVRLNIKITAGRAGHELAKFCRRTEADLLIMQGTGKKLRFFDRFFPHDLEYIMADLPTNLLIVHKLRKD